MEIDKNALAKSYPEEDIQTHTNYLLENLELLKKLYPNLFSDWDSFYDLLRLACIYHDLGKLYPRFQYCLRNRIPYTDGLPHGLLSLAFIDYKWLRKEKGFQKEEIKLLFQAVAYHHDRKMPFHNADIEKEYSALRIPLEQFMYDKLPTRFLAENGINERYFSVRRRFNQQEKDVFFRFIMLEGLLNRLDYAASAHVPVEHPHGFLEKSMDGLMSRWQEKYPEAHWNDLQNYMRQNTDKNVIAIAQTGIGKTEAGLLWLGNAKGFFTLPLKSAINAIYERLVNDIVLEHIEDRVGLLHADTYMKYLEKEQGQKKAEEKVKFESEDVSSDLYYTRTKQLSLPLTICTLDQLFGFVFLYRGFEYKLATLSYAKIIIDEVQMYSPDLIAYLVLGLRYITRMGGRFTILTATLPTFFLDLLKDLEIPFESPQVFTDGRIRHSVKVIDKEINAEDIAGLSQQYGGKKILVICNTIKSAVSLYHQLAWDQEKEQVQAVPILPKDKGTTAEIEKQGVYLLHSNFTKEDRAKKEDHILKMGKKESVESGIWIATQIVEASLDIDFDLLFTELSDLNGLFQRMGRCYRKRELDRLYNCFVFTGGSKPCSGVRYFIDEEIHRLSKEALMGVDGVVDESKKVMMVKELYTREKLPVYYGKIKETIKYVDCRSPYEIDKKKADEYFRNIDTVSVIPRTVFETRQEEIMGAVAVLQRDYSGMDRTQARKLKAEARKLIMNLTVDIYKSLANQFKTRQLSVNKYEQFPIVDCDYNSQEGIIRPMRKGKENWSDFSEHSF
jgi:CRISPR-associated endonuclease/helicase Cas3